jgi:predicted DNA-binding protein
MSKKVSITLDDEVLSFIDKLSSNRSSFINQILLKEKHKIFMKELEEAYLEEANDHTLKAENELWEITVGDGLTDMPDEDAW